MPRRPKRRLRLADPVAWVESNAVPLILLPVALLLIWVAIWRIWLPHPGTGGSVGRTVTTVDTNAASHPTHRVTTVVRTMAASAPSRRSETLAIVLIVLGAGSMLIAVFHRRISSLELDRNGIKIDLTPAEKAGAAELVGLLAGGGARPRAYAGAVGHYVGTVAARRRPSGATAAPATEPVGLSAAQATALAERIAERAV